MSGESIEPELSRLNSRSETTILLNKVSCGRIIPDCSARRKLHKLVVLATGEWGESDAK